MFPGLEGLSYKARLDRLGHCSLGHRRLRGEVLEAHTIMRSRDKVDGYSFFSPGGRGVKN